MTPTGGFVLLTTFLKETSRADLCVRSVLLMTFMKQGWRRRNQKLNNWFNSVLENSPVGITALKAIRDKKGKITDLEYVFANRDSGGGNK